MEEWATQRGCSIAKTRFFANDHVPRLDDIDWLIVMGGPMSVNDEDTLPWLIAEKRFIAAAIQAGKTVLGFCLGSQIIAHVLGAQVKKNTCKEIGWFDLRFTEAGLTSRAFARFPRTLKVFQWHGETFDVPKQAALAATNEICTNQALVYGDRVVGMQFHLEVTQDDVRAWIRHGSDDLTNEKHVQTPGEMLDRPADFERIKKHMYGLLDDLAG
jgi:GMP synthase-like glutamine amidotransferase